MPRRKMSEEEVNTQQQPAQEQAATETAPTTEPPDSQSAPAKPAGYDISIIDNLIVRAAEREDPKLLTAAAFARIAVAGIPIGLAPDTLSALIQLAYDEFGVRLQITELINTARGGQRPMTMGERARTVTEPPPPRYADASDVRTEILRLAVSKPMGPITDAEKENIKATMARLGLIDHLPTIWRSIFGDGKATSGRCQALLEFINSLGDAEAAAALALFLVEG